MISIAENGLNKKPPQALIFRLLQKSEQQEC